MPSKILTIPLNHFKLLSLLLKKGYPLSKSLLAIDDKYIELTTQLENGISFQEVLLDGRKGLFYDHVRFFLEFSTLSDAIDCAVNLIETKEKLKKHWLKETTYPLFVFAFSLLTLFLFTNVILPQMSSLFEEMGNMGSLRKIIFLMKYVAIFLIIASIVLLGLIIMAKFSDSFKKSAYQLFFHRVSIIKEMISYNVALNFYQLMSKGCSTRQIFSFLNRIKQNAVMQLVTNEIKFNLEQGVDFTMLIETNDAFCKTFKFFFKIGIEGQNLENTLLDYLQFQEEKWIRTIKIISKGIQLFAYCFIAVLVIIIYQIMLVPMELMSTF